MSDVSFWDYCLRQRPTYDPWDDLIVLIREHRIDPPAIGNYLELERYVKSKRVDVSAAVLHRKWRAYRIAVGRLSIGL